MSDTSSVNRDISENKRLKLLSETVSYIGSTCYDVLLLVRPVNFKLVRSLFVFHGYFKYAMNDFVCEKK